MAKVTIYTTQLCGFCHAAKRLLNSKDVAFDEIDVMMDPEKRQEMMSRAHGRHTVPQIFVDDTHLGGCDDLYELERSGKLDTLLAS